MIFATGGFALFSLAVGLLLLFAEKLGLSIQKWLAAIGIALSLVGVVAGLILMFVPPPSPDVTLSFVYPREPALVMENRTDLAATNALVNIALFDLDSTKECQLITIPTQGADFIRGHSFVGPNVILSSLGGHRIVGAVMSACANCRAKHAYWVAFDGLKSQYISELVKPGNGPPVPGDCTRKDVARYAEFIHQQLRARKKIRVYENLDGVPKL